MEALRHERCAREEMLEAHEVLVLERQRALQEEETEGIVDLQCPWRVNAVTGLAVFGRSWWFAYGFGVLIVE